MKQDVEKLLIERGKTHGEFSLFARYVQELKSARWDYQVLELSDQQHEALDMIFHKIARIVTGDPNHKDSWDDIAGYATLGSKSIKNGSTTAEGKAPSPSKKQVCGKSETAEVSTTYRAIEKEYTLPPSEADRYFVYWR